MVRSFDTHHTRPSRELAGLWDFCPVDPVASTQGCSASQAPDSWPLALPVPGCWEQHPDLRTWRGVAWYRKRVVLGQDCLVRLEFKGVSHTATVFWDGVEQTRHYNAYTPFSCLIPEVAAGSHEILVRVDNRFTEDSALHVGNDYFTYGGIIRPVLLQELQPVHLERLEWEAWQDPEPASLAGPGPWQARVSALVRNAGPADWQGLVRFVLSGAADGQVLEMPEPLPLSLPAGQTAMVSQLLRPAGVRAWSAVDPALCLVRATLEPAGGTGPADDLIERVGFRQVTIRDGQILVNGQSVYLKGFNRHEDMGLFGAALPLQVMHHDLCLLRDMGCNMVRTSHYPNDELFLDLCDELGFYVWEENHARGLQIEQMRNPNFDRQCSDCNREMVLNHRNHPAIIVWGLLNECASWCEEGKAKYRQQYDQIRRLDPSRPVTHASCHHGSELCLDLCDIVSMNVYSGWYNDNPIDQAWQELHAYIQAHGGAGKPCLISEFGGAALYGWRDPGREKWSEERQADILEQSIRWYATRPEIRGLLVWQFADCRVTEGSFYARPRCHNNKGVVDDWRRPKLAYASVRTAFRGLP